MDQQNNDNGDRRRDESKPEPKRTRAEYPQENLVAPGTSRGNNSVVRDTCSRQGDPSTVDDSSGRVLILNSGGAENHDVVASHSVACYLPQSQGNQNQVAVPSQSSAIFRPLERTPINEATSNFPVAPMACIINNGIMLQDGTGSQAVRPGSDDESMYIFGAGKESIPGPSKQVAGVVNHGNMRVGEMKNYIQLTVEPKAPKSDASPELRIEFNLHDPIQTFTGRVDILDRLHKTIQNNRQKATQTILSQVIVGIGGIGKTETTRKYASNSRDFYCHRLWINAETYSEAKLCFFEVASRLGLSSMDFEGNRKKLEFVLEDIYDTLCKKLCLIIFDNANAMDTNEGEEGIRPFLPKTIKSGWEYPAILVTSRNRNWGPIQVITLDGLDESDCYKLLQSQLKFQDTEENHSWARQITSLCEGLPLVVQQVIAVVREESLIREYTLETFLEDFERKQEKCVKTIPADSNIGASVFTIFSMAFERLASKLNGQLATKCLDVMALLNPDNIPVNLLHELLKPKLPKDVSNALLLLHKHNLITLYTGSCKIHRVIQLVKTIATPAEEAASSPCVPDIRTETIGKFSNFLEKLPERKTLLKTENLSHILENGVTLVKHIFERPFQRRDCSFVSLLSDKLDYFYNNRKLDNKEASSSFAISKKRVSEGVKFNILEPIDTFTGRENVLEEINVIMSELVTKNNPNKVLKFEEILKDTVVLEGDAGVGKTETARKYIQLYGYHFKHILWLNAETVSQARECLLETASMMQVSMSDSSGNTKPFNSIIKEVYQILFKDTCLMVFDNFEIDFMGDNLKTFFPQCYISAPKLPCVIITSRHDPREPTRHIIKMSASHNRIENNGFLKELQFEESEENREIAEFIENILRALNSVTLSVLDVCFREKRKDSLLSGGEPFTLKEFVFEVFGENFKVVPYHNMIYDERGRLLQQLYNFIFSCIEGKEDGKLALDCFITMTLLYPDRIPITLLDYLLQPESEEKLSEALFLLETFKLIRRHGEFCTIHREIQKFGRKYQNIWNSYPELTNAGTEFVSERVLRFSNYLDEVKFDDSSLNIALENAIYFSQCIISICNTLKRSSQILFASKISAFYTLLIKKLFLKGRYPEVPGVCDRLRDSETLTRPGPRLYQLLQ